MSYELKISAKDRAVSRLISQVRKLLTMAALDARENDRITQQGIADKLAVNRSVVNRLLKGTANLTLRSVAEVAWALGYEVHFVLKKAERAQNVTTICGDDVVTNSIDDGRA